MADRACCSVGALITRKQGRDQELIREHRELPDKMDELGIGRLPVAKPPRVGVVGDDAVMEQVAIDAIEELAKLLNLLLRQFTPPQTLLDARRDQVVMQRRCHEPPSLIFEETMRNTTLLDYATGARASSGHPGVLLEACRSYGRKLSVLHYPPTPEVGSRSVPTNLACTDASFLRQTSIGPKQTSGS